MTVRVYKSTDTSAPVLTGQAGSLIALLDACLVNGYGSKAAAGWTKEFSATNRAAYRNSPILGTGFYCDVNDAAAGTAGAKEALVRGYETMTAVGTGTGLFPTVAQMATGIVIAKSSTADATARVWTLMADETVFYLFTEIGLASYYTNPARASCFMFGDIFSYKPNDPYRCMIIGRMAENIAQSSADTFGWLTPGATNGLTVTISGHYIARGVSGLGGAVAVGKHSDGFRNYGNSTPYLGYTGYNTFPYPNPANNGLFLAPISIHHNSGVRGYLKGVWNPLHDNPLGHGDTFSGSGALAGKNFLTIAHAANNNSGLMGEMMLETSDTWS